MLHRRSFLTGLVGLIAAPAIVRAESLMPVRSSFLLMREEKNRLFEAVNPWVTYQVHGLDQFGNSFTETIEVPFTTRLTDVPMPQPSMLVGFPRSVEVVSIA